MKIVWSFQSRDDLQKIRRFIARDAPNTATSFVRKLRSSVDRLRTFPESGHIVPEVGNSQLREVIYGPYRIIYGLSPNRVEILTVFHGARLLDETQF